MNKRLFLAAIITFALIIVLSITLNGKGGGVVDSLPADGSATVLHGREFSFLTSMDFGFSFPYVSGDEGYVAQSGTLHQSGNELMSVAFITRSWIMQAASEGPPAITVQVFRNPMNLSVQEWITQTSVPIPQPISPLVADMNGGMDVFRYAFDGLYRGTAAIFSQYEYMYLFTVSYNTDTDQIIADFEEGLSAIRFAEPEIPASLAHGNIIVDTPQAGASIESPLTVSGRARGTWFFEASFPVVLTDWDGGIIATGIAQAQKDWMTENFVPFAATFDFPDQRPMSRGSLILEKDNPSGMSEFDDAVEMTVFFK